MANEDQDNDKDKNDNECDSGDDELHKLNDEMKDLDIPEDVKKTLKNIYRSYKTINNNHIFVEGDSDDFIAVGNRVIMGKNKITQHIDKTKTLFLSKCTNVRVAVGIKINHIVIENCKNITVRVLCGLISGIDILNSTGINLIVENSSIYYLSCGSSIDCTCSIKKTIANKLLISTMGCYNITLHVIDEHTLQSLNFKTNRSIFPELTLFTYELQKNKLMYSTKTGSGELDPNC